MNPLSPAITGFRLAFRRPAIPLAEIAWRWTVSAAAWFLGVMFAIEYMDSLPVTPIDRLLLGLGQPVLVARAAHHIFRGSALRLTEVGTLIALALVAAWIVIASLGRGAVVNSIATELEVVAAEGRSFVPSLLSLNFLRAATALAAIVCVAGSAMIASSLWASRHIDLETSGRLTTLLWVLIVFCWLILNWFLSVACMFACVERRGVSRSIDSTIDMILAQPAAVFCVGIIFGLAHFAAFIAAVAGLFVAMTMIGALPAGAVALFLIIAMLYSVVADYLYTARLAAYVSLLRKEGLARPADLSDGSAPGGALTQVPAIDKDELILSDLPAPAM